MKLKSLLKITSLNLIIMISHSIFGQTKFDSKIQLDSTKMLGEHGWFPGGMSKIDNPTNESGNIWYQVTLDKNGKITNLILLSTTLSKTFEQTYRKSFYEKKYFGLTPNYLRLRSPKEEPTSV